MPYIDLEGVLYTEDEYQQLQQLVARHKYAEAKPIVRTVLRRQRQRATGVGQRRHHSKSKS